MSRGSGNAAPASWVIGLIVVLCAVLLLKWLALVAIVAVALLAFVRWARGGWDEPPRAAVVVEEPAAPEPAPEASPDDCTWCGRSGGHRDVSGRLVRPRHVHATT